MVTLGYNTVFFQFVQKIVLIEIIFSRFLFQNLIPKLINDQGMIFLKSIDPQGLQNRVRIQFIRGFNNLFYFRFIAGISLFIEIFDYFQEPIYFFLSLLQT